MSDIPTFFGGITVGKKLQKENIAILGGGCGAISAAFELCKTQPLRDRFDVTIYTEGWRLGGKAASGRNSLMFDRIEEHGLHMLMGFYQNAFTTIKDIYHSVPKLKNDPFQDWEDAFEAQRKITLELKIPQPNDRFKWEPWTIEFPHLPGTPGDPLATGYLTEIVSRILDILRKYWWPNLEESVNRIDTQQPELEKAYALSLELDNKDRFLDVSPQILAIVKRLQSWFVLVRDDVKGNGVTGYKMAIAVDLMLAVTRGYLTDILHPDHSDFEAINDQDFKEWLQSHGAADWSAWSAPVRMVYDLAFAYVNGRNSSPNDGQIAAGATLHLYIRMAFNYKDAPLWRMKAGMGDVIFAPAFRLLEHWGVKIVFFRRVQELQLSADKKRVEKIHMWRQADLKSRPYKPLVNVKNYSCWPSAPDWSQIKNGGSISTSGCNFEDTWCTHNTGTETLDLTRDDFHSVIVTIPPLALTPIATALAAENRTWEQMLNANNIPSVPTISAQAWFKPTLTEMGWSHGATVSAGYEPELTTWGEMSQVLPSENWPIGAQPGSCEYLCGTFLAPAALPAPGRAPDYQQSRDVEATGISNAWLDSHSKHFWPHIHKPGGGIDPQHIMSIHVQCNIGYSAQYVQTPPGSVRYRLWPNNSGFENVYVAGDWTRSTIDGGSAEAAFDSGRLAAEAIITS